MTVLTLLGGLVVVRRGGKNGTYPGSGGNFFSLLYCILRGIRRCSRDDRHATGGHFNSDINHRQPLLMGKRRSFAGGATRNEKIYAGLDLPGDQIAQSGFVNRAVLLKRCD